MKPTWKPVDYSKPVEYSAEVHPLSVLPRINGVYMLAEGGRFYVGQSIDVPARIASHRMNPCSCNFADPKGVLLAAVPLHVGWDWNRNNRVRLNAEARFIAAAIGLGLVLTNKLGPGKLQKLLSLFPDLSREQERIKKALPFLC